MYVFYVQIQHNCKLDPRELSQWQRRRYVVRVVCKFRQLACIFTSLKSCVPLESTTVVAKNNVVLGSPTQLKD